MIEIMKKIAALALPYILQFLPKLKEVLSRKKKSEVDPLLSKRLNKKPQTVGPRPYFLEIISIIKKNSTHVREGKKYKGVSGSQILIMHHPDMNHPNGAKTERTVQGVMWESQGGDQPTNPTSPGQYFPIIRNTASNRKKFPYYVASPKETEIFIHKGRWTMGCFVVGDGFEADHFLDLIGEAVDSKDFRGCTHEVQDERLESEKKKYPLTRIK